MSNKNDSFKTNAVGHHSQQPSKLLMRHAVKRPQPLAKHPVKAQGRLNPANPVEVQTPLRQEMRLQRAAHTPKSKLITHFSAVSPATPVSQAPAAAPAPQPPQPTLKQAMPIPASAKHPITTSEILQNAINQATAHQNKPPKHPHSRVKKQLSIVASVTVAVGLLTVIAANSLPGAQLHVASAKAGIDAKLPNYKPSGFSQSGLNSSPGEVAAQFQSQTDARNYTITQRTTDWDSTALANNFVAKADPNYHSVNVNGRVVYIYGNHNAAWVFGGIWYTVETSGALTDQQLIDLANSL